MILARHAFWDPAYGSLGAYVATARRIVKAGAGACPPLEREFEELHQRFVEEVLLSLPSAG